MTEAPKGASWVMVRVEAAVTESVKLQLPGIAERVRVRTRDRVRANGVRSGRRDRTGRGDREVSSRRFRAEDRAGVARCQLAAVAGSRRDRSAKRARLG